MKAKEIVYELTGDPENPVQKDSVGGDPNTGYPQKPMSVGLHYSKVRS